MKVAMTEIGTRPRLSEVIFLILVEEICYIKWHLKCTPCISSSMATMRAFLALTFLATLDILVRNL